MGDLSPCSVCPSSKTQSGTIPGMVTVRRVIVGQPKHRYKKEVIIRRVLAEKEVLDNITGLKQRLRMLQMMRDDCQDLIRKRKQLTRMERKREVDTLSSVSGIIVAVVSFSLAGIIIGIVCVIVRYVFS